MIILGKRLYDMVAHVTRSCLDDSGEFFSVIFRIIALIFSVLLLVAVSSVLICWHHQRISQILLGTYLFQIEIKRSLGANVLYCILNAWLVENTPKWSCWSQRWACTLGMCVLVFKGNNFFFQKESTLMIPWMCILVLLMETSVWKHSIFVSRTFSHFRIYWLIQTYIYVCNTI